VPAVLFILFLVVPLIELLVILQVGELIGGWPTLLLLVAMSVLGAWIVRREGTRAWRSLQAALRAGRIPSRELADGALVLVGGTLLLTPGFVTDAVGLFLVLPVTRPVARRLLTNTVALRFPLVAVVRGAPRGGSRSAGQEQPGGRGGDAGADGATFRRPSGDRRVVPGEVVDGADGHGGRTQASGDARDGTGPDGPPPGR
jgi:UPF0716 protein FxsA